MLLLYDVAFISNWWVLFYWHIRVSRASSVETYHESPMYVFGKSHKHINVVITSTCLYLWNCVYAITYVISDSIYVLMFIGYNFEYNTDIHVYMDGLLKYRNIETYGWIVKSMFMVMWLCYIPVALSKNTCLLSDVTTCTTKCTSYNAIITMDSRVYKWHQNSFKVTSFTYFYACTHSYNCS